MNYTSGTFQCPKCKAAMFPDFYAASGANCEINMDYYNSSVIALANSNIWILIQSNLCLITE